MKNGHNKVLPASILTGLLLWCGATAACQDENFQNQVSGSYLVELSARQPKLVLLEHSGADLSIKLNDASNTRVNSPGGRNAVDVIFLETEQEEARQELCFLSVYNQSAPVSFKVREITLNDPSEATRELFRLFNTAGAGWLLGDTGSVESAALAYETLYMAYPGMLLEEPDLDFYAVLGAAYSNFRLRKYDNARRQLNLLGTAPLDQHSRYYQALWQIGRIHMRQSEYPQAIAYMEEAKGLTLSPALDQVPGTAYDRASININLGEAYATSRELGLATASLEQARQDAGADFELLGRTFNNSAYLSVKLSEQTGLDRAQVLAYLDRAIEQQLTALYFYTEAQVRDSIQISENNLAVDYARVGERRKSLIHFSNVLRMLGEFDNPESRAFFYSNLSNYSQTLGDYNKAIVYLLESIKLSEHSDSKSIPAYHCRLGTLYRMIGALEVATRTHEHCLELAGSDNTVARAEAFLQLSVDYLDSAQLAAAQNRVTDAIALLPKLDDANMIQTVRTQEARVLLATGYPDTALTAVEAALCPKLANVGTTGNSPGSCAEPDGRFPDQTIAALVLAMNIHKALNNPDIAIKYANTALQRIETLHAQLEAERLGPAWSNQSAGAYFGLAEIFLDEYDNSGNPDMLEKAYETLERSRDISFRQQLSLELTDDPASLEEQKQLSLFSNIASMLAAAGRTTPVPEMTTLNYYHQHDLLSISRLNNIQTLPIPETVSLDQLQLKLEPGQLVLYYLASGDNLRLLGIDNKSVKPGPEIDRTHLESLLDQADITLHSANTDSLPVLLELSRTLLPNLEEYPDARELLIVGQTGLHALPFSALSLTSNSASENYTPLMSRYSLKFLPSVTSFFMSKPDRQIEYVTDIAIIADPVFENLQFSVLDQSLTGPDRLRGWTESLQPLPYTAAEARNIEQIVHGKTVSYTGKSATRRNLSSQQVRNARVLHIATHGYFKSTSEDNIGLALSTVDETGNKDPGFITLTELFGFAFNNELVVISGCDTAMGREQAGVGLNSLTRGFLAQGVKHVVSTLWPVSDRASAKFMTLFYSHLQSSKDVTKALQLAQQDLSKLPDYRNPYYWGGYIVTSVHPDSTIALAE